MVRVELRGEMSDLRSELRGEMSEVRGGIAELRSETRVGLAELSSRFDRLVWSFDRLSGELHRSMASQTRAVIVAMFRMMATSIGGVVSVAALVH
jgi:hypothetical protein